MLLVLYSTYHQVVSGWMGWHATGCLHISTQPQSVGARVYITPLRIYYILVVVPPDIHRIMGVLVANILIFLGREVLISRVQGRIWWVRPSIYPHMDTYMERVE